MLRKGLSWLHRWVSLMAGLVLVVLGLSGSLLVWQAELDAALNPGWFRALPTCDGAGVAGTAQDRPVARVLALLAQAAPGRQAGIVVAPHEAGAAYQVWERRDRQGVRREHFIDPTCGRYLGFRDRGLVRWDAAHFVPTVYELHRYFWSGESGATVAGTGGLVLFGLGLTGLVLAWPRQALRWASWRRVLTIRWDSAPARRWYDVHRTVGLWLLPVLLLISLTGAALVFGNTARAWVAAVLPTQADVRMARAKTTSKATPDTTPSTISKADKTDKPDTRLNDQASPDDWVDMAQQQFPAARWSRVTMPVGNGPVEVRLLQPGEPRADTGNTRVRLSPQGVVLNRYDPLNAPAGNVLLNWLFPLHSAEAFGAVLRVVWSVFGLLPTLLLGTGLWLWWRRRRAVARARPDAALRAA
ncbi:putative iron-regulated membrane protein [Roseateles depolymerans]|nr:putative iron-regulated membrane protein [Roseateles depolymerans]